MSKLAIHYFHRQRKSNIDPNKVLSKGELFVEMPDETKHMSDFGGYNEDYFYYLNNLLCDYKIGDGVTKYKDLKYTGKIPAAVKLPDLLE
jgi:hypothetical protein